MPSFLMGTIGHQVETGFDPTAADEANRTYREEAIEEARIRLASDPAASRRFDIAVERGQKAYPVREDNEFFTMSAPSAQFRYAILEVGQRLAERNVIEIRDDVTYLHLDEATAALSDDVDMRSKVQLRTGQRAWAIANPGPPSYGEEAPLPSDLSFLPADTRLPMEAMLWSLESIMAVETSKTTQRDASAITGTPASAGTYTGPVRVVRDETEFSKIEAGDVLVCAITSPVWSVLFPSIGALVTDSGGILSHPAIIAREYRIPAVVATGNATELLRDEQMVTVDGTAGTVQAGTR
jgi:pyruvate,water dikinase